MPASQVEISIPTTITSTTQKPYTLYNISLRLPLRSYIQQKRYSDFTALHSALTSQASSPPPATLPSKSWFTRTTSSPELTEERRKGLSAYLTAINEDPNERWRNTSAWRTFLNLPSTTTNSSSKSSLTSNLHNSLNNGQPITDPVVWLDHHRDLKSNLQDARLALTRRDQASTIHAQHEASAQAKKCLVRAGTMIGSLDTGLQSLSSARNNSSNVLGEGELRRRKDMLASAKREREGLENLLNAMSQKSQLDKTIAAASASTRDKAALLSSGASSSFNTNNATKPTPSSGRVLGKETSKTRALDNQGVLQLQQQMMQEQDADVMVLAQAVSRQKELGVAIQEELEVGDKLLEMLGEDVDRVQGKMDVARKRVDKIS